MAPKLFEHNLNIILIQLDEAHSDAWPVAIETILGVEQPKPQQCFQDRINRANQFVNMYNPPFDVYIDGWNNEFAELFRAWPDKYHCVQKINSDFKLIAKSKYHKHGDVEAKVVEDYTDLLISLMK
ncbi:MAG: hypothetical protein Homavirus2_10 [Homavirus sp.]|uniref:Uncharacterized protein n=1 Tax=Homavirus sp. TaxID=2487769 RepID=A0A3G5A444_9VIRU|nr:MAG: hypothetical protein Homavirus2_10 [Homavirus sp.]